MSHRQQWEITILILEWNSMWWSVISPSLNGTTRTIGHWSNVAETNFVRGASLWKLNKLIRRITVYDNENPAQCLRKLGLHTHANDNVVMM